MLTKLKHKFQKSVVQWALLIHRVGLKPNTISLLGLILGLSSGMAYWLAGANSMNMSAYRAYLVLALLLLLFSGLCDAIDGALARICGGVSALGGFLDSIIDRYVDSAVLLGLILGGLCDLMWGVLAIVGSLLTSYARARAESLGVMMESVGFVERAERIVIISVSSVVEAALPYIRATHFGVIILAVSSNLTVLQRIIYFYGKASRPGRK